MYSPLSARFMAKLVGPVLQNAGYELRETIREKLYFLDISCVNVNAAEKEQR